MKLSSDIYQKIDYKNHPAFQGLTPLYHFNNERIEEIIEEMDSLYNFIIKCSPASSINYFKKTLVNHFKNLENEIATPITDTKFRQSLIRAIRDTEKETLKQLAFSLKKNSYNFVSLSNKNNERLVDLITNGYSKIEFSSTEIKSIQEISNKLLSNSKEHYKNQTTWRGARSLALLSESGHFFVNLLKKHKIEELISNYKKSDMTLCYMGLDYSHERQTWFKGCYDDIHLSLSDTNYFHFDNDINVCKMMIYLSDVEIKNGPFHFAKKSTNLPHSYIKKNISSALDRILGQEVQNHTSPIDYYRPLFKDHRQVFANIPQSIQLTTHFGDDLLNGSPASKALIDNSEIIIGKTGTSLIFDGYEGIHKGSTVETGERLGLQIAFIDKNYYSKPQYLKKKIRENHLASKFLKKFRTSSLIS